MSKSSPKSRRERPENLSLRWEANPDLKFTFATHFVVQSVPDGIIVNCFQVHQPIVLGDQEAQLREIGKLGGVPTVCVARLVLPVQRAEELAKLLTAQAEKNREYVAKTGGVS